MLEAMDRRRLQTVWGFRRRAHRLLRVKLFPRSEQRSFKRFLVEAPDFDVLEIVRPNESAQVIEL